MAFGNGTVFESEDDVTNSTVTTRARILILSWLSRIISDPFVVKWFGWLMTPVVIAFVLPFAILLFIWSSSLVLYIHKVHKRRLMHRLREAVNERDIAKAGREIVAALWDAQVRSYYIDKYTADNFGPLFVSFLKSLFRQNSIKYLTAML